MTMTSQLPAVIDWLVAGAKASPLLTGVTVVDGPQVPAAVQALPTVLWVGCDPGSPGDPVASAEQDWPVMDQGRTRDEDGDVVLAARHRSGDSTSKVRRDGAAAIVGGVELLLRGTPQSGGPGDVTMGNLVQWAGVDGPFTWSQRLLANGAECLVTFHIRYRARLLTTT